MSSISRTSSLKVSPKGCMEKRASKWSTTKCPWSRLTFRCRSMKLDKTLSVMRVSTVTRTSKGQPLPWSKSNVSIFSEVTRASILLSYVIWAFNAGRSFWSMGTYSERMHNFPPKRHKSKYLYRISLHPLHRIAKWHQTDAPTFYCATVRNMARLFYFYKMGTFMWRSLINHILDLK